MRFPSPQNRSTLSRHFGLACVWVIVNLLASPADGASFRKGPYLIYPGDPARMTVLWQTDEAPTNTSVEWCAAADFEGAGRGECRATDAPYLYSCTLTGLSPGKRYYYRVSVDGERQAGSFLAAPGENGPDVVFYGYGDTRTHPDMHDKVCRAMLRDMSERPKERQTMCLHSGDWTTSGDVESSWDDDYFNRASAHALELMSCVPIMGCRGNHEGSGNLLRRYWPYEYRDESGCYYSFDYGPVHFTVIDQYDPHTEGSPQYEWLRSDLASTSRKWKVVVIHEPAWSAGAYVGNEAAQRILSPLFEDAGVALVFAGHNHYYARCSVRGVEHITSGGGGADLYIPDGSAWGVVASAKAHHFVRMQVSNDTMSVAAYRDDGSVLDEFSLGLTQGRPVRRWFATNRRVLVLCGLQGLMLIVCVVLLLKGRRGWIRAEWNALGACLISLYLTVLFLFPSGGLGIQTLFSVYVPLAVGAGLSLAGMRRGKGLVRFISLVMLLTCLCIFGLHILRLTRGNPH